MDGKKFSTIALVLGADPGKSGKEYGFKEQINARNWGVFYRIVHLSKEGVLDQSDQIKLVKHESLTLINPGIKQKAPELL